MVLPVLSECINSTENVAVAGFELILSKNMDIFNRFRPSTIFNYIEPLFILLKPVNSIILTVVDKSASRDGPSFKYDLYSPKMHTRIPKPDPSKHTG